MIDLRLWRIALLTVPLAAAIAMFSLQAVPSALAPGIPPDAFDPDTATPLAKQLATTAPYPAPGSSADNALANQVKERFAAIAGATVSEQRFDSTFHGHTVHLRNLIATLPGESNREIALIAPRDVAEGSGAVTSTAATATLLEIAQGYNGASHNKTLVFVSTDGSSIGALGAKHFVQGFSGTGLLDAAIVLSQPAIKRPTPPLVIPWSTGAQSTSSQLSVTANQTVAKETGTPAGDEGAASDLFRLALPAGLGEQAPLIDAGLPAVRLSADGELPIDSSRDTVSNFSVDSFDRFGRAALSLMLALDGSRGTVQHGPGTYIGLAGNLLPGWTIAMLTLALLLPVGLAAGLGLANSARSPIEAAHGVLWSGLRVLPFLGALILFGVATLVGIMPSPSFPFDPKLESLGAGGTVAVIAAALLYCAIAFFLRPLRSPPERARATAAPAALSLACVAALALWVANPYLAFLVALGLQTWLLAAARGSWGKLAAAGLVLVGLLPLVALVANVAGRFHAGAGVWHDLLLMLADGQIGVPTALLGCVLGGAGVAIVAAASRGAAPPAREMPLEGAAEISVRRQTPQPEPEPEPGPDPAPDQEEEPEAAQPEPGPEPERDPRLWSKPRGWSSSPPGSVSPTPLPSVT